MLKSSISAVLLACAVAFVGTPAIAQSSAYQGQPGVSQEMAFLVGKWRLAAQQGTTISEFLPDGSFISMAFAPGARQGQGSTGQFQVLPLGNGRFKLMIRVNPTQRGQRPRVVENIMQITPDGRLYNETAKAFAQRL
ncbi:hypothetical protein [Hyphomonas johnsonii]|uniref:Lipoprotein n=1 Tax=Hyphomonas johnsonii MHS-2 TaxID=1280950 RepID=A0A059FRW4_9PROT|nr:hypothetical protein [Hyphomonas johnsonii]KCZ93410.1 hypothetical protein HJO_06125 [Hyphomonas johnsonii MHS-2]